MKLQDLFEMPKDIEDLDSHDLNNSLKNGEFYLDCLRKTYAKKIKLFDLTDYSTMYQFKTEFFVLDSHRKKVTYFMKYKVDNNGTLGQFVWQSLVWGNIDVQNEYLSGIPKKIFFDYLLSKFHTIITDSEQTWHGKRFWQARISDAFKMNLNVYFFDFDGRIFKKLEKYEDLERYQNEYDIWGPSDKHEMKRMVISDIELKTN